MGVPSPVVPGGTLIKTPPAVGTEGQVAAIASVAGALVSTEYVTVATAAQGALADSAVQPGDLGTVATTNDYNDLGNLPTLGSAAAEDSSAFAAAAHAHAGGDITSGTVAVARLPAMVGDSGSGGTAGLVPAPGAGDASKLLSGAGTWVAAAGSGDMLVATYDPTAVGGDAFDMANMVEATDAKVLTAAERSLIASALQSTDIDTLSELNALLSDATLVDTTDTRLSDSRTPTAHAASHTNGTDDIQSATNAQKGLATAAHVTAIEANTAKVTYPAASTVLTDIKTVDGTGSGLDADLLDGNEATAFATAAQGGLADSAVQPGNLATVATTGAYSDLSGTPTLGTAAAAATTDFAPALGVDDNYVTDAEKTVIGNTSGTNTGDQDLSGYALTSSLGTAAGNDTGDFEAAGAVSTHAAVTSGVHGISAFAATVLDDADAATARATLGVDAAGTDNSTDVTLAGTPDYLTISGQEITLGSVDLTTDVTGALPAANGGTGQTSLASVDVADFGSGAATDGYVATADGAGGVAWEAAAAGAGDVAGPASAVDSRIAAFDGTTGKLLKDGGSTIANVLARANHTGTQVASTISDFDTSVAANSAVAANTAKTSNATHTGDVTGSTELTIANEAVTYAKMQKSSAGGRLLGAGDHSAFDSTKTAILADAALVYAGSYPTDPDCIDETGNGVDGTFSGTGAWAYDATLDRYVLDFDGAGEVKYSSATGLPNGSSDRTIAFWVKIRSIPTSVNSALVDFYTASGQSFILSFSDNSGTTYLFTDGVNAGNNLTIYGTDVPAIDTWTHVIFTLNGATGDYEYYLDNSLKLSGTFGTAISTAATGLSLGRRTTPTAGAYADALMGEIVVLDRVVTSTERAYLSNVSNTIAIPAADYTIEQIDLDGGLKFTGATLEFDVSLADVASQSESEAGTASTKLMTPQRTQQAIAALSRLVPPEVILEDQRTSGTGGGTSTSGAWYTATLNTEVSDALSLCTLSSNQFTFTETGWIEWGFAAYRSHGYRTRLYNVTDATEVEISLSDHSEFNTYNAQIWSRYQAAVVAGKTYRIERRVEVGYATVGLGVNTTLGVEKYGFVHYWRT